MTDENRPEGQQQQPTEESSTATQEAPAGEAAATAVAAPPGEEGKEEEGKGKLRQDVQIKDAGPCRKHIRVAVNREDIDARMAEHFSKLVGESVVTGFRPGKAPRRLIEKRFGKEVSERVKGEVLLASLEQLGEDHDVAPLAPPDIDPDKIEFPKDGPLVYEFEVEVRPQFDLPTYRGLKLKRPIKTFTDQDVTEARRRLLAPQGQVAPKEDGTADLGDILIADMTVRDGGKVIGEMKEVRLNVEKQLAFKDGLVRDFSDKVKGARAGDTRTVDVELSSAAAGGLAGKTVQATIEVKDVKTIRLPELTDEYVQENFGVANAAQMDELIKGALERNLEHQQRRSARVQVLEQIAAAATWDLPQDMLKRQARRALSRRIMEMKADGMSDQEIAQQRRLLEQDILKTTELTLKEHFVLQKIAEVEKIKVEEDDVNDEIERMADEAGESPRRVRARLEKEDMMEALMSEMIERKALDLILDSAEYEDVQIGAEQAGGADLATVEAQAVPGEMQDPAAPPPEEEKPAEAAAAPAAQEGQ